jgi:hypothetical protein
MMLFPIWIENLWPADGGVRILPILNCDLRIWRENLSG